MVLTREQVNTIKQLVTGQADIVRNINRAQQIDDKYIPTIQNLTETLEAAWEELDKYKKEIAKIRDIVNFNIVGMGEAADRLKELEEG